MVPKTIESDIPENYRRFLSLKHFIVSHTNPMPAGGGRGSQKSPQTKNYLSPVVIFLN